MMSQNRLIAVLGMLFLVSSLDARQVVTVTCTGPVSPVIVFSPADLTGRFDTSKKHALKFDDGTVLNLQAPKNYNGCILAGWTINSPGNTRSVAKKGTHLKLPLVSGEYSISADYVTEAAGEPAGPHKDAVVYKKGGVPVLGGIGRFMADLTHKPDGNKQDASKPVESNNSVSNFFTTIFGSNQQK
ncbi:hypothetical protein GX645_02170 [Candidatus Sumerlaeota bacterium]|nr:hypothetical protein [Candidatus Sumerlaeales bacterium]NLD61239.1 hypothetical protein [Candidatus Sumerlaeota bacterium]